MVQIFLSQVVFTFSTITNNFHCKKHGFLQIYRRYAIFSIWAANILEVLCQCNTKRSTRHRHRRSQHCSLPYLLCPLPRYQHQVVTTLRTPMVVVVTRTLHHFTTTCNRRCRILSRPQTRTVAVLDFSYESACIYRQTVSDVICFVSL